jgi:hypothetical protein
VRPHAHIENQTDLPLAGIREVVGWTLATLEVDRWDVIAQVKRSLNGHHTGRIQVEPYTAPGFTYLLILRIPQDEKFPCVFTSSLKSGPPPIEAKTWQEALVCITAHEGMHLRQVERGFRTKGHVRKPAEPHLRRVGKKLVWVEPKQKPVQVDGRLFSEREAEWAEHVLLELYRERRR